MTSLPSNPPSQSSPSSLEDALPIINDLHRSEGGNKGLGVHLDVLCVLIDSSPPPSQLLTLELARFEAEIVSRSYAILASSSVDRVPVVHSTTSCFGKTCIFELEAFSWLCFAFVSFMRLCHGSVVFVELALGL